MYLPILKYFRYYWNSVSAPAGSSTHDIWNPCSERPLCKPLIIIAPEGQIIIQIKIFKGTNIINVARKHKQHLFYNMKKQSKKNLKRSL